MTETKPENLTDHSYDGIQEYDNPTPGWWVAIFVFTVIFSAVYGVFFHFSPDATNVKQSYDNAIAEEAKKQLAKLGTLKTDEASLVGYMQRKDILEVGRTIFRSTCTGCHGSEGQGATGPNMTDDYYKNIKKLSDIPNVIKNGASNGASVMPAKGGARLSDIDIVCVAAYIASLRGKNLPGNPHYGELIPPWPTPAETNPAK
jgi:cytochrome c oxidase cbb3-type subunit 3